MWPKIGPSWLNDSQCQTKSQCRMTLPTWIQDLYHNPAKIHVHQDVHKVLSYPVMQKSSPDNNTWHHTREKSKWLSHSHSQTWEKCNPYDTMQLKKSDDVLSRCDTGTIYWGDHCGIYTDWHEGRVICEYNKCISVPKYAGENRRSRMEESDSKRSEVSPCSYPLPEMSLCRDGSVDGNKTI